MSLPVIVSLLIAYLLKSYVINNAEGEEKA
jgi:hypothetical protein